MTETSKNQSALSAAEILNFIFTHGDTIPAIARDSGSGWLVVGKQLIRLVLEADFVG